MTQPLVTQAARPPASLTASVYSQLFGGPDPLAVVAELLRTNLKELYPALDIDPNNTVIGEPQWDIVDGEVIKLITVYATLSDMLSSMAIIRSPVSLIEGQHYLTQLPVATPAVHLPVRIDQIGRLLNELAPTVYIACQEQQLAYWNASPSTSGPRWHVLAETLQSIWDVQRVNGWTSDECTMARQLFLYPDPQVRKTKKDPYDVHAYLIDIDIAHDGKVKHFNSMMIAVLIGTIENREVILTYSLRDGFGRFDSQKALGQSIPAHLPDISQENIQWRLYEPSGNYFNHLAFQIIDMQIDVIGSLGATSDSAKSDAQNPLGNQFPENALNAENGPNMAWVEDQLPDWLQSASSSDQISYARYLKRLSELNSSHAGKTYRDGIPSISEHALTALSTQMLSKHPDASTLDLEKIEIEVQSVVAWGSFIVPGEIETTRFTLVELALQNLVAIPVGDKTIRSLTNSPLPEWMTVAYVESLISEVDVGRTYPELIKRELLDDPAQSQRRQDLYTSQLRIQLPLLALQNKLRGIGALDERGCRYVAALMEPEEADRQVDGQTIVMRRLAFVPERQLGALADVVTNMFVIGPQDPDAGPCVLYQPMLEPQLCQHVSPSNLLYAIRQITSLRQSVLAWLPDAVRPAYSRYVFPGPLPSPWSVVDFLAAPLGSFIDSGPVTLSSEALEGDILPLLYSANVNALVELADHQSLSNRESRWESFKQTGWLMFNLVLPFLGTTVGTATWIWQILDDVEQIIQDDDKPDKLTKWEAYVDVLMILALALTTHAIERAREASPNRPQGVLQEVPQLEKIAKPERVIEQLTPIPGSEKPPEHYGHVHISGALGDTPQNLAELLATFRIEAPEGIGSAQTEGVFKGLYERDGNHYAKLANQWFEVQTQGDQAFIVDATTPARTGPPLASDGQGHWRIDARLRLRGSGSVGTRRTIKAQAVRRSKVLLEELNRFEQTKPQKQILLTQDVEELKKSTNATRELRRQVYLSTLKTQRESYEDALNILLEWPVFQAMPDYARTRLSYLNAQVNFTLAELAILHERLTPTLTQVINIIDTKDLVLEQQHIDSAQAMITVGDDMIERLDYVETRFEQLKSLGQEGCEFVKLHRSKLPSYISEHLRMVQLDMYRHLCLTFDSLGTVPEGWEEINQIIDNLTVAAQSLVDAISEPTLIRQDEQIDALGSLTEQLTAIDEHLVYAAKEYEDSARPEQMARVRARIEVLKKRAARHLATALDERGNRRRLPSPYVHRPRPRKTFIRARFWGMVSGEPRLSETGEATDLLDVKNPLTGETIATFHHKRTGEWVPRERSGNPSVVPPLETSVTKANALINGLDAFKRQAEAQAIQPNRTPTGTGLIMHAHARRLQSISTAIKKALAQAQNEVSNETIPTENRISPAERSAADKLRFTLESEARDLHILAYESELKITKQSPPTMSRVIWLRDRNQISITKQMNRRRIKGADPHYLDRYEIKDKKTNKTLWFADFHYSANWVPDHAFYSARLKTPEQANQGKTADSQSRLSQRQRLKFYRSAIAVDQAKDVFFPQQP